jgi:uncharacterized repeat protein (TIGR01451 family)
MSDSPTRSMRIRAALVGVTLIALGAIVLMVLTPGAGAGLNPDLHVEKSDSPDPVQVGDELTYTITVTEEQGVSALQVVVEDTLPNKVKFVSAEASQGGANACDRNGRKVTCELGDIAASGTAMVTIVVQPKKAGTIENTASAELGTGTENDPADNEDTEKTKVVSGPSCGGDDATIVGTTGDDEIIGTDHRDVITALAGDDFVKALGGKDAVCGKGGNDTLKGNADGDLVKGGGGRDTGKGGGGDDVVKGGRKADRLRGGAGDDVLNGGPGNDNCRGGPGDDILKSC